MQRRDVAVHRVQAFAQDQFRPAGVRRAQQLLEMLDIVVAPYLLFGAGFAHALDHGIVVERVGEQQAVRQQLCNRGDAGLVRDIARGKDQRGLLAVQLRQFALELDQRMIGAGDIARPPGPGAHPCCGLDHRAHDFRMLGHAEVIVRAPDHHVTRTIRRMPDGMRKPARQTLEIGKNPVAPLVPELFQRIIEKDVVVHDAPSVSLYKHTSRQVGALEPRFPAITLIQIRPSGSRPPRRRPVGTARWRSACPVRLR